ncbi:hypothetical protein EROM_091470 [Encephalitozoon romaleae SJ-2008]|uniref:Uncharacterized protein n=1 Tax=Encephalitozoon romaleae (strain SJ-2008) TaxID=1178016 RepID=I6ZKF2_ENCRO|nr:hypothetical protein EROM_091470 [Encephalitozoon romaleae SJ-2008]AFN83763.1 hypothetical protein EROM_091470 [Encephalitozoon romaleae SJ-2008]
MASQRILDAVDLINNLLKTLPMHPKTMRCHGLFIPREMVGSLRKKALENTLPILERIIDDIRSTQEKHRRIDSNEICNRREFATNQLRKLRLSMENEFEENRVNEIKSLLSEIEYYEKIGVRLIDKVSIGKEVALNIFRTLSHSREGPTDPYIGEYLKKRVSFSHEFPSDIEVSSLKAMLRFLQENMDCK